MRKSNTTGERGQAFTLEAVVAAIVVVGSLLFALQVSGVTSLTASTSSQQVVTQQERAAEGVLDAAVANDTVRRSLLYWNDTEGTFHPPTDDGLYTAGPPTAFGSLLNQSLSDRNVGFNVNLLYVNATGVIKRKPLVRNGQPSDDAARATRTVVLYDDDQLLYANGTRSGTALSAASSFYAPDRYPDKPIYNVIRVEVVVWRI